MNTYKPPYPWPEPMRRKWELLDKLVKMYQRQGRPESHIVRMWKTVNPKPRYQEDF